MKKKLLTALFMLLVLSLAGPSFAQQVIRFVTHADYPPFESVDAKGNLQGFDIDLAKALCQELNARCTFAEQAFDGLIPALKFNRFDAAISAMDITPARQKVVSFSNAYYQSKATFVGLNKLKGKPLAKGNKIGVGNGTTYQAYLLDHRPDLKMIAYGSYQDALIDLKNGRVDRVFGDSSALYQWIKQDKNLSFLGKPIEEAKYFGQVGIAVKKSNSALLTQLNQGLKALRANGQYQILYEQYFGE